MIGFLEKQLERQIALVCLLSMDVSDTNDLAKELGVTDKTIVTDIDNFNTTCFPAYIEIDQYKGVTLKMPGHLNLDDIFVKILNISVNIRILKCAFIEEPTLSDIAAKLFLSKTSVRRSIAKINTYFAKEKKDVKISIDTKVTITGNEIQVRKLFSSMFREIYKEKDLPHFETIYKMLKRCLKKQENPNSSASKMIHAVYYIFTSVIRIGNNHLIPEENLIDKPHVVQSILSTIQEDTVFCTTMDQKYKFAVNQKNVSNILSSYISLLFANPKDIDNYTFQKIGLLIKQFYFLLDIEEPATAEKIVYFSNFIDFYKELTIFRISYTDIFYNKILKERPRIWKAYQNALVISNLTHIRKNDFLYKELLLELMVSSKRLLYQVEPKLKEKSILVLSSQEAGVSLLYKNLILNKYPFFKTIDIYKEDIFTLDYYLINQYDLVLTDLSLNSSRVSSEILKISKVPTRSFWSNLEKLLYSS
ncbi:MULTISPECIES: helix-turn-helix domain-containing protein [unclassified Enterococcus]|jgi:hypothetical protein|uniref:helix-turn-helix domain-containing protein n=1 Tax=unclassified Enterococcus TaxID=2608891 RepID=UPI003D2B88D4